MLGKCAAKRLTQKAWDEVTLDFSLTFHAASRPLSSDLCMGGRSRTGHMEEGLDRFNLKKREPGLCKAERVLS